MKTGTVAHCICSPAVDLKTLGYVQHVRCMLLYGPLRILWSRVSSFDNSEGTDEQIS